MTANRPLRIVVTGGSGFIGSALVRKLVLMGHDVLNIDALTYAAVPGALDVVQSSAHYHHETTRIESLDHIRSLLHEFTPDAIFHLAAETHVDRSIDSPDIFVQTNVVGTASMLRASSDYIGSHNKEFRFIHVSTDEVFGSADDGPFTRESPYRPNSPYAASKAGSDHLVRAWHNTYGFPAIVTNCSNNYGAWQFPEKLIPRMITRAIRGLSMPLYGDGLHQRDWLYVEDHVRGLILTLQNGIPGRTYLFGSGVATTNLEIVQKIAGILDDRITSRRPHARLIEHVEDRPGHDREYLIDPSMSAAELSWRPATSLSTGLRTTVEWYLDNAPWWQSILDTRYDTGRLGLS